MAASYMSASPMTGSGMGFRMQKLPTPTSWSITSFENELVNVDPSEVSNSTTVIRFMLEIVPTAEPDPWLRKQQMIQAGKPSVAGVVLFSGSSSISGHFIRISGVAHDSLRTSGRRFVTV
jgi:hypothetical protein